MSYLLNFLLNIEKINDDTLSFTITLTHDIRSYRTDN